MQSSSSSTYDASALFRDVYGIPASLLGLLSRTTYLSNLGTQTSSKSCPRDAQAVDEQIKAVEDSICNWKNPVPLANINTAQTPLGDYIYTDENITAADINLSLVFNLNEAMHSALLIYFYRQVRRINPTVLQHFVSKAITNLLAYEQELNIKRLPSAAICWPAFIVACEALDHGDRDQISGWLLRQGQRSGIRNFEMARDVAMQVWEAREATRDVNFSWTDIFRKGETTLVLT